MAHCKECAGGFHKRCIKKNKDKITGCPANCQHKKVDHSGQPRS